MPDGFWPAVLPAWLGGLALSFVLEALLLRPRPAPPWRRPVAALAVHAGVWTAVFALELALFRRPLFAAANVLAIEAVLALVNHAKYRALREPFVYPDFAYFADALRHPRLYLPFLGAGPVLAAAAGYGLALWAGLALEPPVAAAARAPLAGSEAGALLAPARLLGAAAAAALAGLALAAAAGRRLPACGADAVSDLRRLGLAASLWGCARAERAPVPDALREAGPFAGAAMPAGAPPAALPDLVVVQSESFFDIRRYTPLVRPDVLARFDALRERGALWGSLKVGAWGANTVRTEFAFLAGLPESALGAHRYNPYRRLARQGVPTLASYLRTLGYRTVCVHPYDGRFYRRDRVLPALGFDEFIDIAGFGAAARAGAYVGDRAVAERVADMLGGGGRQPLYVHVITMENHGPLHWERVAPEDAGQVLAAAMPSGCEELVAYARHLRNADAMLERLAGALAGSPRPGGLCLFGDHVPIMDKVYRRLGPPGGDTDYLVWSTQAPSGGQRQDLDVHELAPAFLGWMGLMA